MKGDAKVIEILNEVLTSELTAINQYFIHHKMLEDWGYSKLSAQKRGESIDEMKHADAVIARILWLEGIPNMQRLNPVKVGENVLEMHQLDVALEYDACDRLNRGIQVCREARDNGTAELLERILEDEEDGIDFLETQLKLIDDLGLQPYLAEQIHP